MRSNIFIHIPKTAGTSILTASGGKLGRHLTVAQLGIDKVSDDTVVFSCVRNPYDRAVSIYHYMKREFSHKDKRSGHFLDEAENADDFWINHYTPLLCKIRNAFPFFQSQFEFIRDGDVISKRIDMLVRYEHLETTWKTMRESFGFDPLPTLNSSESRVKTLSWEEELSTEAKRVIFDNYRDDFKHLGYNRL